MIDVRTPVEFREIHAEGAELVPLDRLDPKAQVANLDGSANATIYVICTLWLEELSCEQRA